MQNKQIFTQSDGHPLISFIIPYYNLPKQMLKECLESILALTLNNKEKEIIVVDVIVIVYKCSRSYVLYYYRSDWFTGNIGKYIKEIKS